MRTRQSVISFGIRGMAAALRMTEDEVRVAVRAGEIAKPSMLWGNETRWGVLALADELKKRAHANCNQVVFALEALLRAEIAEGWHDA